MHRTPSFLRPSTSWGEPNGARVSCPRAVEIDALDELEVGSDARCNIEFRCCACTQWLPAKGGLSPIHRAHESIIEGPSQPTRLPCEWVSTAYPFCHLWNELPLYNVTIV